MAQTFGETLIELRRVHTQTAYRQLAYRPVYFSQEETRAAIDELERHGLAMEPLSPLQKLAVRMLMAGMHDR